MPRWGGGSSPPGPLHLVVGSKLKPMKAHGIYGAGLYKGLDIAVK